MMKAHKAIELLRQYQENYNWDADTCSYIEDQIISSVKFQLDLGSPYNGKPGELDKNIQSLRLPFPLCYFDVPGVGGILVKDNLNHVVIQPFLKIDVAEHEGATVTQSLDVCMNPDLALVVDKESTSLGTFAQGKELEKFRNLGRKFEVYISNLFCYVVHGLQILNCSNVQTVDNPPPEALNKKRLRSGKVPFFSYKTLHIKTQQATSNQTWSTESERNGPRLHLRRGHIRRLASGCTTWVQSCMVGSSQRGLVIKDYHVT
jgi:hypothetical protein